MYPLIFWLPFCFISSLIYLISVCANFENSENKQPRRPERGTFGTSNGVSKWIYIFITIQGPGHAVRRIRTPIGAFSTCWLRIKSIWMGFNNLNYFK